MYGDFTLSIFPLGTSVLERPLAGEIEKEIGVLYQMAPAV
jgi:hypothetical protein